MKKTNKLTLSIGFILLLTGCNNTLSKRDVTTSTLLIDGITYQHKAYGEHMSWDNAKKYCQKKGDKWRLPTFNELQKLTHQRGLNNAPKSDDIFWTMNEDESMPEGDYHLTISSTGQLGTNEAHLTHSVLCVK